MESQAANHVQLGNNRGNKYSKKSTVHSPASSDFWNFSMDQFAFHDIPDSIDYILATTSQPSLSYIGFSQGTAQAFATLSIHPTLNDRVDVFVALAPAMSPAGLYNSVVDALMKASPEVIFLAFGRRSILSSTTMWQSILYPPIFVRIIDSSLSFLFNWTAKNISAHQKLAAYPHLYSFTSTKSMVHWFQIIRNKSFQMYDDDVQAPLSLGASDRYYKVAKFPTRNIKTPIVLLYGGSDSLVDINVMLQELPKHTVAREVPHFEHLDFLWAQQVDTLVFPYVYEALGKYAGRDHLKQRDISYRSATEGRYGIAQPIGSSDDDVSSLAHGDISDGLGTDGVPSGKREKTTKRISPAAGSSRDQNSTSLGSSPSTEPTSVSLQDKSKSRTPTKHEDPDVAVKSDSEHQRGTSTSSARSLDLATKFGKGGISVGASKATVGEIYSPRASKRSNTESPK